jgi:hypothetical protein
MPNLKAVRNKEMEKRTANFDDLASGAFAVGAPAEIGVFLHSFAGKKFIVPFVRSQL